MVSSQPASSLPPTPETDLVGEIDTRTRLLAAAGPIFAHHGFNRATVREICSAAKVNIASVGYYFGDKLGLYRGVIAQIHESREQAFPVPAVSDDDPRLRLHLLIHTLLSRMVTSDQDAWETDLLMREMQNPTPVLKELVRDSFQPMFEQLKSVIRGLIHRDASQVVVDQLALSAVGQCLYYRVGQSVLNILIPDSERCQHYDVQSLSEHVTAVILAATSCANHSESAENSSNLLHQKSELIKLLNS
ncbi:CerR family C-terminal domain-containing protein [Novipirellula artificiosorum]|uniref:Putative HTH-type transcriptional regulator YttP n=1 Tax=Novipirellula artificiosorum TaxID=2528016 RepID=A0A5C6D244_9BACT|nr:CerR family C-terminal domain-containing protein [Novipirellula artificiosorum]TWU31002.1 putative HTH-type transcriptional regulator YttP [Novipirellula artificiosorum]